MRLKVIYVVTIKETHLKVRYQKWNNEYECLVITFTQGIDTMSCNQSGVKETEPGDSLDR